MTSYNSFALFYDHVMGDRRAEALLLHRLIRRHAPKARTLLELGCGTGSLVRVLEQRYRCKGIDLSPAMVRVARRKVPTAQFLTGDITLFELHEKFDVIICSFDTINHVLSFAKWREIFRRASAHLNPGGIFIFDINTEYKLERYVSERAFAERMNEDVVSVIDAIKTGRSRYTVRVSAFVRDRGERFVHHELLVPEVTFASSRIQEALRRHFQKVVLYDPERRRPSTRTEELYFICQRGARGEAA